VKGGQFSGILDSVSEIEVISSYDASCKVESLNLSGSRSNRFETPAM